MLKHYQSVKPIMIDVDVSLIPEAALGTRTMMKFSLLGLTIDGKLGKGTYSTDREWEQKSIEAKKLFKDGWIWKVKTKEEIEEDNAVKVRDVKIKALKGTPISYSTMKRAEIVKLAKSIGIGVMADGNPMKNEALIEKVKKVLE